MAARPRPSTGRLSNIIHAGSRLETSSGADAAEPNATNTTSPAMAREGSSITVMRKDGTREVKTPSTADTAIPVTVAATKSFILARGTAILCGRYLHFGVDVRVSGHTAITMAAITMAPPTTTYGSWSG